MGYSLRHSYGDQDIKCSKCGGEIGEGAYYIMYRYNADTPIKCSKCYHSAQKDRHTLNNDYTFPELIKSCNQALFKYKLSKAYRERGRDLNTWQMQRDPDYLALQFLEGPYKFFKSHFDQYGTVSGTDEQWIVKVVAAFKPFLKRLSKTQFKRIIKAFNSEIHDLREKRRQKDKKYFKPQTERLYPLKDEQYLRSLKVAMYDRLRTLVKDSGAVHRQISSYSGNMSFGIVKTQKGVKIITTSLDLKPANLNKILTDPKTKARFIKKGKAIFKNEDD